MGLAASAGFAAGFLASALGFAWKEIFGQEIAQSYDLAVNLSFEVTLTAGAIVDKDYLVEGGEREEVTKLSTFQGLG